MYLFIFVGKSTFKGFYNNIKLYQLKTMLWLSESTLGHLMFENRKCVRKKCSDGVV